MLLFLNYILWIVWIEFRILETAMGTQMRDDNSAAKSYKKAIYDMGGVLINRFMRVYLYPDFIYKWSPLGRRENKYLKVVHNFTENVIKQRREYREKNELNFDEGTQADENDTYVFKKKKKTAMLDLLLSAEKEGLIDGVGIQEEVDTFMFEVSHYWRTANGFFKNLNL